MSNPITDLKRELLAAAERQHVRAHAPVHPRGFGGRVRAARLLPVGAALAVVAAVALFFTTPWSNSPSFLERAQAALTPPKGTILHEKWVDIDVSIHPPCTVKWTTEIWIDEADAGVATLARTHRFRAYPWRNMFGPHAPACPRGSAYEVGGIVGDGLLRGVFLFGGMLRFVPPNRLVRLPIGWNPPADPVADLRRAIRAGCAHDEGKAKRDGRTVERIRINFCPSTDFADFADFPGAPGEAYVDPDTFYPVEIDNGSNITRFVAFEYLPRTAANLALTNIRVQHPHATGPG
jgi:hypothetical protein